MNDFLKLISNSLKPFGYHVREYRAPNILRLPALEKGDKTLKSLPKGFYREDSKTDHMIVYLRTCIRSNRNVDLSQRMTKTSIEESTLRCLNSLITSLNNAIQNLPNKTAEMIILDDRSDEEPQNKIKSLLERLKCEWTFKETNETGQGKSLHQQFAEGRTQNALTYFVEDDYLHEPDGLTATWEFYDHVLKTFKTHSVIYPQEHSILYDDHYPSYILAGKDRRWRTMRHATHTFLTHGHVVDHFWKYFENTKYVGVKKKRKLGSEARTTNKLFEKIPGLSPLKPVAVHLQFEGLLPPLFDWKPLWDSNKL